MGEDTSRRYPNGELTGDGISHVAFDFTMEVIAIRAKLKLDPRALPPALRPIEAEIAFDDICSRGISIVEQKSTVKIKGQQAWMVTVTVNCKRPPRFFTEFEGSDKIFNRGNGFVPRRRATAMDFAITGVVRRIIFYTACSSLLMGTDGSSSRTDPFDTRGSVRLRRRPFFSCSDDSV